MIPVEFPTELKKQCPDPALPCFSPAWLASVGPPRHTPEEWATLLNTVATSYWEQSTYNETKFEFTVLNDPETADGWWPAPHSMQDYYRSPSNWGPSTTSPPSYPMGIDVPSAVFSKICENPLLFEVCAVLPTYERFVVIANQHEFGGQSDGNNVPISIPVSGPKFSPLWMTGTLTNEDTTDDEVAVVLHELGHQLGDLSHYGDCSSVFEKSSLNPVIPSGPIECLGQGWDIMGYSYSFVQPSAYTKYSQGWITSANAKTFDLSTKFSDTIDLLPLESKPASGDVSIVRLAKSKPTWPNFTGYYAECRAAIGGDIPSPFPAIPVSTLTDTGLLITNVHENFYPAHHVERTLLPTDNVDSAALQPGNVFETQDGLSITLKQYVTAQSGAQLCEVSVANTPGVGKSAHPMLQFVGNLPSGDPVQGQSSTSISADIALNQRFVEPEQVGSQIPVSPVWPGHDNPLSVRVHNRSGADAASVAVNVNVQQPAVVTDSCGMQASPQVSKPAVIANVSANSSATASFPWTAADQNSVSIQATAQGPANQIASSSTFAYQFHLAGNVSGGQQSIFEIAERAECPMSETYFIMPAVHMPGWRVSVEPQAVDLSPGTQTSVTVNVVPPADITPGTQVEIPILVTMRHQMMLEANPHSHMDPNPFAPGLHTMVVGKLTTVARVVEGPGSILINVPQIAATGTSAQITGKLPGAPSNQLLIEYRSPSGTVTHVVPCDADGGFSDGFTPGEDGVVTVQAWWSGGSSHSPVESSVFQIVVGG